MAFIRLLAGSGILEMTLTTMNFRIEIEDGSGAEEYRVRDGYIEARRTHRKRAEVDHSVPREISHEITQGEDQWRRLSASEIANHVHGDTAVAQWLRHRIGWRRLLLACTDKETLDMFGVDTAKEDRRAA